MANKVAQEAFNHLVGDLKATHGDNRACVVLYGRDPFETVRISDENLRHQTEYELRSKLIQLRRLYIPASASVARLRDLMSDSLSSFATLFAPVLMLHGEEPPVLKREVVRACAQLLELDGAVFERVFELREAGDAAWLGEVVA